MSRALKNDEFIIENLNFFNLLFFNFFNFFFIFSPQQLLFKTVKILNYGKIYLT